MIDRFICNFLNGQHIIHKIRHVQTVRQTFLHQCIKNECPAVLSCACTAPSSKRPRRRSKLLDDYRNNRTANLQLADLGDHVLEFALDPFGSRFIEQKLACASPTEKAQLLKALHGRLLIISMKLHGCAVIKAVLKSVDKASQIEMIEELRPAPRACVIKCIKDHYGSKFMDTIFELIEPERLQFVVDAIINSPPNAAVALSLHEYGSRVIRRVLEHCTEQQKRPVLEQIHANVLTLVAAPYGLPEDRRRIVRCLRGDIVKNAQPEYICGVIDKCLVFGAKKQKKALINELCVDYGAGNPLLLRLAKHSFANFVVRKMIRFADSALRNKMMFAIKEHIPTLRSLANGKYVIMPEDRERIVRSLHKNVLSLVTDPYGCFVIEHVIEHGLPEDRELIVRSLQGNIIMKNAHHKGFCNVIHKCLIFGTMEQKDALIDEVCVDNGSGSPPLLEMIKHPFGNNVVQKMMDVADSARRLKMMFAIKTSQLKTRKIDHQMLFKHSKGAAQSRQKGGGSRE
uniref:PUM-HD domain-containing protein n=1 Tax=Globodera rostochiensis TaxID=31243 RepID=A0A914H0V1_GLORO